MLHRKITSVDYGYFKVFAPKNQKYRIISIDTCLLSKDDKDFQQLRVCNEELETIGKAIPDDERPNILIMHHGVDWLTPDDARKFEHWIEDHHIDVVYCGHTHRAAVESYNDIFREVKQFTSGALVMDKYAIPSFYVCEMDEAQAEINIQMFTYSSKTEDWVIDNHHLRKFKDGKYHYGLSRKTLVSKCVPSEVIRTAMTPFEEFHAKYLQKYGSNKIYSNKFNGEEVFNSWKIVHSLVEVGVSYPRALELTDKIIQIITDNKFICDAQILSCNELRTVIYDTIIGYHPSKPETEFDVSCWASRYARRYSRDTEIIVLKDSEEPARLNYNYIKNTLLLHVINKITGDAVFFKKISSREKTQMAESVLSFLKNMGLFEIKYDALEELIIEYITQKPHPWIVFNNRETLLAYHKLQGENHITQLKSCDAEYSIILQTEAAYHICAAFLIQYDDYSGCTETSPIIILANAVNHLNNISSNKPLPVQKFQVIQLKKDLVRHEIPFEQFIKILISYIGISLLNILLLKRVRKTPCLNCGEYS